MNIIIFFKNIWASILALFKPIGDKSPTPIEPVLPSGQLPTPVTVKVLFLIFNPRVPSAGNKKLSEVLGWNDPDNLANLFINDILTCSHGYANYVITQRLEIDAFPRKEDGFVYTPDYFVQSWQSGSGFHSPDMMDYPKIISDYALVSLINNLEIDEVWMMGFPYAGFRESRMAGPGAFFCNGEVIPGIPANRRFIIMGFNYQRDVGEMFESFAHRAESIIEQVYRNTSTDNNFWRRFTLYDQIAPGKAEVGSVHFAPNSQQDYDWGNPAFVASRHANWYKFPDLSGSPTQVNCQEWGNGDTRLHHMWWLNHFPYFSGTTNGLLNNWWEYVVNPNQVK